MLRTPVKVILLLVALEVSFVSGFQCYECSERDEIKDCPAPKPTMVMNVEPKPPGVLHCTVSISYNGPTKKQIVEIWRDITNLEASDMAGLAKTGAKVMDSCDDVKKFPAPVLFNGLSPPDVKPDPDAEHRHTCYCSTDMCNSAIIHYP